MNKTTLFALLACVMFLGAVLVAEPALAGPGGRIARAMTESFWGKLVLVLLVLFFLPLIIWVLVQEHFARRRTLRDLAFLAERSSAFDWLRVKQRVLDCFHRVHAGWRHEDVAEASEYMTSWYWQNQQLAYLDRWKEEGLVNHCSVKKVLSVSPLMLVHRNEDGIEHNGSLLVVAINARMKDYLARRDDGKVVEGSKRFQDVETAWSFELIDGEWRVNNIEESEQTIEYARLARKLPRIETTLLGNQIRA